MATEAPSQIRVGREKAGRACPDVAGGSRIGLTLLVAGVEGGAPALVSVIDKQLDIG